MITNNTKTDVNQTKTDTAACPWQALESQPGLNAIPALWRQKMGDQFDPFARAFLTPHPEPAAFYPCRKCGCSHEITIYAPDDIIAVCTCEPWDCQHLTLTPADIQILELNWTRLGRAVAHALGLTSKPADLGLYNTRQIGSWGPDAVPVILTIQHETYDLNYVIMSLATRLRQKFILLGPTTGNLDANCQETLANAGAAYFSLAANVRLTESGALQSRTTPGELFAKFRPEPTDHEDMLRKAIALAKATDSQQGRRKVTLYTVMRLYCFDNLEPKQIATKCGCALSLIYSRLESLKQKLGRDPAELRHFASQFERMEKDLTDSRAKDIHRASAIHGEEES